MTTSPNKKLTISANRAHIKISWTAAFLLVVIGIISFVYADGFTILYRSGLSLITPHIQFEIKPQSTIIPANSSIQIYIDAQIKNSQDQLLEGFGIAVTILSGQAQLSISDTLPTDISQRWWLTSPSHPQVVTLSFTYKHLIKTLVIDVYDPTPPTVPTIKAPINDAIFSTATPIISGEAPTDTRVEIYIDGMLNSATDVKDGNFSISLQTALKRGKHILYATSLNKYQVRSNRSDTLTIDIQTPDPEIDLLNLRISPKIVKAGQSFRIFVPISSDINNVELILETGIYTLQDIDNSSVFSGEIPAPSNPGLYSLSLVITSNSEEKILVEKVASIQVN